MACFYEVRAFHAGIDKCVRALAFEFICLRSFLNWDRA